MLENSDTNTEQSMTDKNKVINLAESYMFVLIK